MQDKVFVTMGATSHSKGEREENDYYATDPSITEELLKVETFSSNILEPACGEGHISKTLINAGYNVSSYDLVDRGYGKQDNFLTRTKKWNGDIITNPPYKDAQEFVNKALSLVDKKSKVAMFLKIQFLEGISRQKLFKENPPKTIYVSIKRANCAKNGDFDKYKSSAMCYAWFVWEKGYKGCPQIKWINA